MLRLGKMYTATDEYNIFILCNPSIYRLEIGDAESQWHDEKSVIFYGEYDRQKFRTFGDNGLSELYRKTIEGARNLDCVKKINSQWIDGVYIKETVMLKSDDEYYGYSEKHGLIQSELCRYGGVTLEIHVFDENCQLDLPPLNHQEYKLAKDRDNKLFKRDKCDAYENCLHLASLFKDMFFTYIGQSIDIDSEDEIRHLLYQVRKLPILVTNINGLGSVKPKAIRALAGVARDSPSKAFSTDIRDKNGKLVLRANVICAAKYPEAIFLSKYRYYFGQAGKIKNIKHNS